MNSGKSLKGKKILDFFFLKSTFYSCSFSFFSKQAIFCRSQGSNSAYFRLLVFYNSYIFFSHFFFLWFTVVYLRLPLTLSFGDSSPIFLFYNFCLVFIGTPTSCSRVWPFLNELKLINVRDQKNELHKTNKRPSPQLNFNWYVLFIST